MTSKLDNSALLDYALKRQKELQSDTTGTKHDSGKDRWSLIPFDALKEVVRVITFGADKYDANNWQLVAHARERYSSACLRHLTAWLSGETHDPETGIHHLAHATCNLLFLLWFELHPSERPDTYDSPIPRASSSPQLSSSSLPSSPEPAAGTNPASTSTPPRKGINGMVKKGKKYPKYDTYSWRDRGTLPANRAH